MLKIGRHNQHIRTLYKVQTGVFEHMVGPGIQPRKQEHQGSLRSSYVVRLNDVIRGVVDIKTADCVFSDFKFLGRIVGARRFF